jgi:hypothetical protein
LGRRENRGEREGEQIPGFSSYTDITLTERGHRTGESRRLGVDVTYQFIDSVRQCEEVFLDGEMEGVSIFDVDWNCNI